MNMNYTELVGFVEAAKQHAVSKEEVVKTLSEAQMHLGNLHRTSRNLRRLIRDWDEAEKNSDNDKMKDITEQYGTREELESKLKDVKREQFDIEHIVAGLQEVVCEDKQFDKNKCFSNIRELIKRNPEVKIGQIEKQAGVQPGYMSRLERSKTSEPSVEFIVTAAKLLGVTVDYLIGTDITGVTPTEKFVIDFIEKLKVLTANNAMSWVGETANLLTEGGRDIENPLISTMSTYSEEFDTIYDSRVYQSQFNEESHVAGTCYMADIPCSNSKVCLNSVKYDGLGHIFLDEGTGPIIEVYIVGDNAVNPVCSTYFVSEEIKSIIIDFYNQIANDKARIGLSKSTMDIMEKVLKLTDDGLPF